MPGNNWDEGRTAEIAMLFSLINLLKDGGGKLDFTAVAADLGEGFTEAGVRYDFCLIFCHTPLVASFSLSLTISLPPLLLQIPYPSI
jgi:hypothetical protein